MWSKIRGSSGTAGSFFKSYSDLDGAKTYYKLSNYDAVDGIVGHECVNEIIVDRLLTILGVEHLSYQLIHANIKIQNDLHTTWLCASRDFKKKWESKVALDVYYPAERNIINEKPLDFCIRNGWGDYIWQMFVVDFLILNRDRHGANIEVLRNSKDKTIRLAPLFAHGLSLVFSCHNKEDLKNIKLNLLKEPDKEFLFNGLDVAILNERLDKTWKMIWERWRIYEDFCNQKTNLMFQEKH